MARRRVTGQEPDLYGVIGHPVTHSFSPFIHGRFAELTGEKIVYERFDIAPGHFAAGLSALVEKRGLKGANVTLPHKLAAHERCETLTERAHIAGAVNTIRLEHDGTISGDNTDGAGLVADLKNNLNFTVKGSSVLLLGASGAARGALAPLLNEEPSRLLIANRTADTAESLAAEFSEYASSGTELSGGGPQSAAGGRFDLVINATSAGHAGEAPKIADGAIHPQTLCYDMVYGKPAVPFVRAVIDKGASRIFEGWGMLVEQAAESFYYWRDRTPETGPVLNELIASYLAAISRESNDS